MKHALITGSLGQDGYYLTEHLVGEGYKVFGLTRRNPPFQKGLAFEYIYGDLRDEESLHVAIRKSWPDEIYNLGGQVYVPVSWDKPAETFDVNTGGLARILKIVERIKKDTKVYQASSSEMFGNNYVPRDEMTFGRLIKACNEETRLEPMSPYGASKAAAHRLIALYRERGVYAVSGMLFNHESPRRGSEMVTRKICRHVAGWAAGDKSQLMMGNLDSRRDWGYSGDYVVAMHLMLQIRKPEDFVIGTGKSYSVRDFLLMACKAAGVDEAFALSHVTEDPRFKRTQEIHDLVADATKAKIVLGWEPSVSLEQLVKYMVDAEVRRLDKFKAVQLETAT